MKKYLLFIISMLCVSIGTWATGASKSESTDAYGFYTLTLSGPDYDDNYNWPNGAFSTTDPVKIIGGPVTPTQLAGLVKINWYSNGPSALDLSGITKEGGELWTTQNVISFLTTENYDLYRINNNIKTLVLPKGATVTNDQLTTLTSTITNLQYLVITTNGSGGEYSAEVKVLKTTSTDAPNLEILADANCTSINIVGADAIKGSTAFATIISNFNTQYSAKTITDNAIPFNIENSCEVTLRRPADATTMASLLHDIKTALGATNICKLTVTGELSNADLAALGGSDMTGATRLDLSGAALASGASIDNLTVPSSLTQLVLPAGKQLGVSRRTEITSQCSNLDYIYSPTDGAGTAGHPDYIYVCNAGGLAQCFENESVAHLQGAVAGQGLYIKVVSNVALNATDMNFNALTNKPTNYAYLDMSDANITPAMCENYRASHTAAYRIILPNNWTANDMGAFGKVYGGSNSGNAGHVAAVYSYSGTTLNVLGLDDTSYSTGALLDARIVRTSPATTALQFVRGTYDGTTYGNFGTNMLGAINNAGKLSGTYYDTKLEQNINFLDNTVGTTITSVKLYGGLTMPATLTFENPTITSLDLTNVQTSGATLTATSCTALKHLYLDGTQLTAVTANCSNLESVSMNDVTIGGDVKLQGTKMTSFTASGIVEGNIDLSYNNKLGSIDIVDVQFVQVNNTGVSTLGNDGASSGDLIVTRQYSSADVTDTADTNWATVYETDGENYTALKDHIKTSTTFGNGADSGEGAGSGRIYPRGITATAEAPYDVNRAGHKQDGCALTITLDGMTEHYTNLSAALSHIFGESTQTGCNLTINTIDDYKLTADDIAAINAFTFTSVAEDVSTMYRKATLNLSGAELASGVTIATNKISNATVQNIILPRGLDKDVVNATNFEGCTALNAAVSFTTGNVGMCAYVKKPGTLRTTLEQVPAIRPNKWNYTTSSIRNVTMTGYLIAQDVANGQTYLDANGEYSTNGGASDSTGPFPALGFALPVTLDIEDAKFVDKAKFYAAPQEIVEKPENMTLSSLGWSNIVSLKMSKQMTHVPADFLNNCEQITDLCIPYEYTHIGNRAFYLCGLKHVTTTDQAGKNAAEVDNGDFTYTFSKNLREIGEKPDPETTTSSVNNYPYPNSMTNPVFWGFYTGDVSDIYIMRTGYEEGGGSFEPTKCYRNAFGSGMTYGWGGFDGGQIYCREKYQNGKDLFTMLHYPDKASVNNNETNYKAMEKTYTDPTKIYTKKDQTGAVDANGESIPWPTFSELGRSYNQAIRGLIWDDWTENADHLTTGDVTGGSIVHDPSTNPSGVEKRSNTSGDRAHYDFTDYVGWHEFVLSAAYYVPPTEIVEDETIIRNYELDNYWYTFCIPFDMTKDEVIKLLGVPASTPNNSQDRIKYENRLNNTRQDVSLMPEIRTMKSVTRTPSSNTVAILTSLSLSSAGEGEKHPACYYDPSTDTYTNNASGVYLRAGYPYYIRPYRLVGTTIAGNNLGKQVMTRYTFPMSASALHHAETKEAVTANTSFARPYEGHKMQAFENSPSSVGRMNHTDATHNGQPYNYTFIGQFWKQELPDYCFYMSSHRWYHYTNHQDGWYWNPYICIIMVTDESTSDSAKGGKFRDEVNTVYPKLQGNDTQGGEVFDNLLKIEYKDGLNDNFGASAREYHFIFDEDIMDFDPDGQATAIEVLDGVRVAPVRGKVYNMAGQYVGNSLEGLSKGMYIVNGKKYVIN